MVSKAFKANNNEVVGGISGGDRTNKTVKNSSKNLTRVPNIRATRKPIFLTPNAKKTFNYLRPAFIKAAILRHFDLESYIQIEINALSYAIDRVLSQLNLDSNAPLNNSNLDKSDLSQLHPIAYFSRKMILIEN